MRSFTSLIIYLFIVIGLIQSAAIEVLPLSELVNREIIGTGPSYYSFRLTKPQSKIGCEVIINFKRGSGSVEAILSPNGSEDILPSSYSSNNIPYSYSKKKISLSYENLQKCESNCKLIISIRSIMTYSNSIDSPNRKIEFSLFYRDMDNSLVKVQPYDYILGYLEGIFADEEETHPADFYSITVPNNTQIIYFELISESCFLEYSQTDDIPTKNPENNTYDTSVLTIQHDNSKGNVYTFAVGIKTFDNINPAYSVRVSTILKDEPDVIVVDSELKSYCNERDDKLYCNFVIPISKEDKSSSVLVAVKEENGEYNDFEIYANIVNGSEYHTNDIPNTEIFQFKNNEQSNRKFMIINSNSFEVNENSTLIVSVYTKKKINFFFMKTFKSGIQSQIIQTFSGQLYYINKGDTFSFDLSKIEDNFDYHIIRLNGSAKIVISPSEEKPIHKVINDKLEDISIIFKESISINSIQITPIDEDFICYISLDIQTKENFNEGTFSKVNTFISIDHPFPSSYYIPLVKSGNDYVFNLKVFNIREDKNDIFNQNFKLKVEGFLVDENFIKRKKKDPSYILASIPQINGEYDSSLRQAIVIFTSEYIQKGELVLFDENFFAYITVDILLQEEYLGSKTKYSSLVVQTSLIPDNNINNSFTIPYSSYFFSALKQKDKNVKPVNSYIIEKRNKTDTYAVIDILPCSKCYLNFSMNSMFDIQKVNDTKLFTNSSDILSEVKSKVGKIKIEAKFPEKQNRIIISIFRYEENEENLNTYQYAFKYKTTNKIEKSFEFSEYQIDYVEVNEDKMTLTVKAITKNNKVIPGEYILRVYSRNNIRVIDTLNSFWSNQNNIPLGIYSIKVNDTFSEKIKFSNVNYDIEGSVFLSVIAMLDEENEYTSVIYEPLTFSYKNMNLQFWVAFLIAMIITLLLIIIWCLYRTIRRYQDKLYGNVTAIDKDIFKKESNYTALT